MDSTQQETYYTFAHPTHFDSSLFINTALSLFHTIMCYFEEIRRTSFYGEMGSVAEYDSTCFSPSSRVQQSFDDKFSSLSSTPLSQSNQTAMVHNQSSPSLKEYFIQQLRAQQFQRC